MIFFITLFFILRENRSYKIKEAQAANVQLTLPV